jgi:hypothetical protein
MITTMKDLDLFLGYYRKNKRNEPKIYTFFECLKFLRILY